MLGALIGLYITEGPGSSFNLLLFTTPLSVTFDGKDFVLQRPLEILKDGEVIDLEEVILGLRGGDSHQLLVGTGDKESISYLQTNERTVRAQRVI